MSRYVDAEWLIKESMPLSFSVQKWVNEVQIMTAPSIDIEPKRGKWEEKGTFRNGDDEPIIEEWQSAMCSVCHKYHTTPYMYYFNDYNFCPNCGADMRE